MTENTARLHLPLQRTEAVTCKSTKSWNDVKQSGMPFTEMSLKELNLQLQKAVDREAFEKAAEIRDLIRLRSEEVEKGEGNESR